MWSPEQSQLSKKTVGPSPSSKTQLLGKPGAGRSLQPAALSALGSLVSSHADEAGSFCGIQSGKGVWINTQNVCHGLTMQLHSLNALPSTGGEHRWCRNWWHSRCLCEHIVGQLSSKSLPTSHLNKAQSGILDGTGSGLPTLVECATTN